MRLLHPSPPPLNANRYSPVPEELDPPQLMGPPLSAPPQLMDVAVVTGVLKALSRSASAAYRSLMEEKVSPGVGFDDWLAGLLALGAAELLPKGTNGAAMGRDQKEPQS